MKKFAYLFFTFAFAFLISSCSSEEKIENEFAFAEYKLGDEILLKSINGGEKTLVRKEKGFVVKGEEDKILMFDFFGTFCTPCQEEAPHLTSLWQKNSNNFIIIGLSHFENVSDEAVKDFAIKYGAYYFLSNSKENDRIVAQALKDINYQNMEQLPFKVVLKNGIYQNLTNFWDKDSKQFVKFYLGKVSTEVMQDDITRILNESKK
ncbi:TPA: TlpA family protein disulfide reductase [Campylobacter lari]|uniref:TlpA family protein disulfide reductase n=1 Tax=Campylobacter lari TaxID=201 RepID=UPI001277683C|nr:thioredoxin domain-containing protein [Campylobacter lari]EAI7268918.1 TlpA family protein disulfide reductase [Campylobacter lari]EAK0439136.1 TlpA family protein disulfide reductase [Campylobacter lari]EAK9947278.1 TlpA family protein disulfide reductase [Campylobacter lari]EDP6894333.1 TlpA family protein disulfide reductase [Campylobacter lari]MBX2682233.1 TlpA family protein disulfide reductase [Campylobacter lari]